MYIDPGAGSLVFQAIAAGAVAVLAAFGSIRRAIGNVFARFRRK